MKASIAGRIRNTNLPRGKAPLPLFKAVVNAFHAVEESGAGAHRIAILAERQGSLDPSKPGPIQAFSISDTGIGFTDDNFDSFNTVDSPYKTGRGGKGLGRFLWLKAFDRVEIDSTYRAPTSSVLQRRKFKFLAPEDDAAVAPEPSRLSAPAATVRPIGYAKRSPRG